MVNIQSHNITYNNTELNVNDYPIENEELDCSICTNELCFPESDYQLYEEWISVNDFETVLIILHTIQIFTGILGNLLVSCLYHFCCTLLKMHRSYAFWHILDMSCYILIS